MSNESNYLFKHSLGCKIDGGVKIIAEAVTDYPFELNGSVKELISNFAHGDKMNMNEITVLNMASGYYQELVKHDLDKSKSATQMIFNLYHQLANKKFVMVSVGQARDEKNGTEVMVINYIVPEEKS